MQKLPLLGAAACAALILSACDDRHFDDGFEPIPPSWSPVALSTLSDAQRELANVSTTLALTDISSGTSATAAVGQPAARAFGPGHAAVRSFQGPQAPQARVEPSPRAADANCTAGGNDAVGSGNKQRSFDFFSFSGSVAYTTDSYHGCANTSSGTTTTLDGFQESGATSDSAYQYSVLGDLNGNNTITVYVDGPDANNKPLHTQQDFLGLIEGNAVGAGLDMRSNLFSTLFASQPNQPDYDGSFQIGDNRGVYEVIRGSDSLNVGGTYAYASTACRGGAVTVTTPAVVGLGTTSAGSGLPVSGQLTLTSGRNAVTYSFNSDGSATLTGSVSGTISAADVGSLLQNGTSC